MNERIKELARKANMVEVEYSPGFPDIQYPKNFEKFAELIVRECVALCNTQVGNSDYNTGRMHYRENIMDHFGVK